MIEKILERLEEEFKTERKNFNDTFSNGVQFGYAEAKKIVQEVAKEYEGRVIELPCKVGDTVYRIWTCGKSGRSIAEFKIEHIDIDNCPQIEFSYRCTKDSHSFYPYRFCKLEDLGKTVFLTRSEAEEALAKMGGKE